MRTEFFGRGSWPDLFRGMRQSQDELTRLWSSLRLMPQGEFPPVNVWTGTDGAIVTAEIPGVRPDQLDVTVHGDTVTLRGNREQEQFGEDAIIHRQERVYGDFVRTVVLPFRVDPDKVAARFERGIVMLDLPRPESEKPRHIKVTHA